MKTTITLKEFSALPSGAVRVTHATAPAIAELSPQPTQGGETNEDFRELLHQRYTAPFPIESGYRHGGINE